MKHIYLAVLGAATLTGCNTTPLESDYGQSVKQMQQAQVFDRTTLTNPSTAAVEGADPEMLNMAVQSLRAEPSDRTKIAQPMTISIGGNGSR